jgi:hypothetical protein
MVWESVLSCFTSGGWDGVTCILSQGILNMAGDEMIAGLLLLSLFFYASFRFKLPWQFTLMAATWFVAILSMKYINEWVGMFILIMSLFIAGFGFYKLWKGKG